MSALMQTIAEGFKQTEVGIIPDDWNSASLHEICTFGGGTTPPRSQHDRYFVGGNNNWIKTTDLNNSLLEISEEQITDLAIAETGLKKHPVGSVLVAMYGGFNQIGRTGYITQPSSINQALVAVKPKPKKLHSYYLLSELNYNVDYWKGVASSSRKDPNITSNDVKNYKIALPSVEEQTAIASALSDVDALLTELENLIAKKQAIKTATMQQLLTGKTRLPKFATYTEGEKQGVPEGKCKGTKPSQLGEIPEDWDVGKFNDVCLSFKTGKLDANAMRNDGEYRFYTCARKHYYIDHYAFDTEALLVSGNGANVGYVHYFKGKFNAYQRTYVLSDFCADVKYLKIYLEERLAERIRVEVNSGNTPYITMDTLTDMLVILPPKEEQTAIATILSDMDNEIQTLEQRLTKTRQIKQGMMQQLLTGRTRLPFKSLETEQDGGS
ncbi:restriction endonuclease subunit S [Pseudoalteromonas sp. MER144-MNA-CIBAN-0113]|uniref:restriction endonuclease subunit S n=1 Tax=Pseudoalteromonas sp. MER144-MNA-CIBAN-0113 TaxID=3140429 RepID=UPI0033194065